MLEAIGKGRPALHPVLLSAGRPENNPARFRVEKQALYFHELSQASGPEGHLRRRDVPIPATNQPRPGFGDGAEFLSPARAVPPRVLCVAEWLANDLSSRLLQFNS